MRWLILSIVGSSLVASCAPASPDTVVRSADAPRPCFDVGRVDNFRAAGWDTLYIRTRPGDAVYELNGLGCRDLDFANRLGLVREGVSGRQVCVGDGVVVVDPAAGGGPTTCRLRVVRALTPTEVEALPGVHRP